MKLKIVIVDFEISPRMKRWALRIAIPAVVVLGGAAVAYATGLPVTWTSGQTLYAADLNNNFAYLQSEISGDAGLAVEITASQNSITTLQGQLSSLQTTVSALQAQTNAQAVVTNGSVSYSVGATTYCGPTTTTFTGDLGGYSGAKAACARVSSCSATAHMCTSEELARSAALGISGPSAIGWFAGFFLAMGQTVGTGAVAQLVTDCSGWGYAGSSQSGPATGGATGPYNAVNLPCNQSAPILCCD
jgi:hypothetical protein